MGLWTRTYKKSVAFYKKAEAKVMKNYFVYLYKDEQKKLVLERFSLQWIGILLPKLFWPTVRKKCSSDREKVLKFEAEGQEFAVKDFWN